MFASRIALAAVTAAAVTTGSQSLAASVSYSFTNITGNSAINAAAGESQLSMTVSDVSPTQALFTFNNVGSAPMIITAIYWENSFNSLSGLSTITNLPGVNFVADNGNLNLPGGNQPSVGFTEVFGVQRKNQGGVSNGLNTGESLGVTFNLASDFNALVDALNNGDRVGFHVQAFDNGGSESFVSTPNKPDCTPKAVPSPTAIGAGLGLLGVMVTRRRRSQHN